MKSGMASFPYLAASCSRYRRKITEGSCKKTYSNIYSTHANLGLFPMVSFPVLCPKSSFNQEGIGKIQRYCNKAVALRPLWWPFRGQTIQESSVQASQNFQGTQTSYQALIKIRQLMPQAAMCQLILRILLLFWKEVAFWNINSSCTY